MISDTCIWQEKRLFNSLISFGIYIKNSGGKVHLSFSFRKQYSKINFIFDFYYGQIEISI